MSALREALNKKRIPPEEIQIGRAYLTRGRNGNIGVAINDPRNGQLAYALRRVKWGTIFIDQELDYSYGPPFGTVIPLRLLEELPPTDEMELREWLIQKEDEYIGEIHDWIEMAWKEFKAELQASREILERKE